MRVTTRQQQTPREQLANQGQQVRHVLGIDGGATEAKAALLRIQSDGSAQVVTRTSGGGVNPHRVGEDEARKNLRDVIKKVVGEHPLDAIAVGMSGLVEFAREEIAAMHPDVPARVTSDVSLPVLGEHARDDHGVVSLVAGTGSAAVRMNPGEDIATSRAGGWGWFLGDEGSGTDLGKKAVQAVLRELEGGPPTLLTRLLEEHYACQRQDLAGNIFHSVYSEGNPAGAVSPLAPIVLLAKDNGDDVARGICEEASRKLANAAAQLYEHGDTIVVTGSVASALRDTLQPRLQELSPAGVTVTFYKDALAAACVAAARLAGAYAHPDKVQAALDTVGSPGTRASTRARDTTMARGTATLSL